jgi:hypothetical protein
LVRPNRIVDSQLGDPPPHLEVHPSAVEAHPEQLAADPKALRRKVANHTALYDSEESWAGQEQHRSKPIRLSLLLFVIGTKHERTISLAERTRGHMVQDYMSALVH